MTRTRAFNRLKLALFLQVKHDPPKTEKSLPPRLTSGLPHPHQSRPLAPPSPKRGIFGASCDSRCQAQICGQYSCRSSNTIQSAATSLSTRLIAIVSFRGCARCQSPCLMCSNAHRKRYPDSEVTCLPIVVDKGRRALCSL